MRRALPLLLFLGCGAEPDTDEDTQDTDTGTSDWTGSIRGGLDVHVDGRSWDYDFQASVTDVSCTMLDDLDEGVPYVEAKATNLDGNTVTLRVCDVEDLPPRVGAVDLLDEGGAGCVPEPAWAAYWLGGSDFSATRVHTRPADAEESAACWMDVAFDGSELIARFACPWLRDHDDASDEDPISIDGTLRCGVAPVDR